ncbi:MAG: zinc ribbon domain-containing protein [Anaerolineales bacterium]|nr:zinc ribbon domain-containing protein [Anaerolineales bacterium]
MKRLLFTLFLLGASLLPLELQAQANNVTAIESLEVSLWPDYDQRNVLVLLTGTLAEPGTVTIPLPENASFHVLARIDEQGLMFDDLDPPQIGDGQLTFTTPDTQFRMEYYLPYTANGLQRSFTFSWQAAVPVNQLMVSVQQPAAATTLAVTPADAGQVEGQDDGLIYHNLAAQSVSAGQLVQFTVEYVMSADTLTASVSAPAAVVDGQETAVQPGSDNPIAAWAIGLGVAGLLLVGGAVAWQLSTQRQQRGKRKPRPRRAAPPTPRPQAAPRRPAKSAAQTARFCHECGEAAVAGDKFCRSCGTRLKMQ